MLNCILYFIPFVFNVRYLYERVAVGRKYPCTTLPLICLLIKVLTSDYKVMTGCLSCIVSYYSTMIPDEVT